MMFVRQRYAALSSSTRSARPLLLKAADVSRWRQALITVCVELELAPEYKATRVDLTAVTEKRHRQKRR